jgi:hypothetical protein
VSGLCKAYYCKVLLKGLRKSTMNLGDRDEVMRTGENTKRVKVLAS